jgi:hypothetical protein
MSYKKIFNRKLLEMLITALLSAGIAFLQSLLNQHFGGSIPTADPIVAGGIGASLNRIYDNLKIVRT